MNKLATYMEKVLKQWPMNPSGFKSHSTSKKYNKAANINKTVSKIYLSNFHIEITPSRSSSFPIINYLRKNYNLFQTTRFNNAMIFFKWTDY